MQSNIQNLLSQEKRLDDIVQTIGVELINDKVFRDYLIDKIWGCDYNYLTLIQKGSAGEYYCNSLKGTHRTIVWATIELKLAVWLYNHQYAYKD